MGQYTTRVRTSRKVDLPFGQQNQGLTERRVQPQKAEYVYSWRDRASSEDLTDVQTQSNWGVRNPRSKGPITDILADRKRWVDELSQVVGGLKAPENFAQCKAYSPYDTGHYFRSLRWESLQTGKMIATSTTGVNVGRVRSWPIWASGNAFAPFGFNESSNVFPNSTTVPGGQPSQASRTARLNQTFAAMAPQAPVAQIGETVVSLLRGEFPSIIRNIDRWLRPGNVRWEEAPRYLGGEYLNSVFGWQPLIRDFEKAIRVLTAVDHLIYGSAFHRNRTIVWDNTITTERNASHIQANPYGSPWNSYTTSGWNWDPSTYFERQTYTSYDVKLSAQIAPIARPGLGANDFVSQAADVLQKLGVWYPALGWDLLPYSWLVDWFVHLGTAINNASFYGVNAGQAHVDYAWAMTWLTVSTQVNFPVAKFARSGTLFELRGSPLTKSVAKMRERATPFGFGVALEALSAPQIAILAALGMVKLR